MRIADNRIQNANSFRAVHVNAKSIGKSTDTLHLAKTRPDIEEAGKKFEVLIRARAPFYKGSLKAAGFVAATLSGVGALMSLLPHAMFEIAGAITAVGGILASLTIPERKTPYLTAQAGEGIKKNIFGQEKLTGKTSKELVILPTDSSRLDFDMQKVLLKDATPQEIKRYIQEGKVNWEAVAKLENSAFNKNELEDIVLMSDEQGNIKAHYANDAALKDMHAALRENDDLLEKMHLTKNSKDEYPINSNPTLEKVKEIAQVFESKPEVLKELITHRPLNITFEEINIVEKFISEPELEPMFKRVLGDEQVNKYKEMEAKRLEIQKEQEARQMRSMRFHLKTENDLMQFLRQNRDFFSKHPEVIVDVYKEQGDRFLTGRGLDERRYIYSLFDNNKEALTDLFTENDCSLLVGVQSWGSSDEVNNFLRKIDGEYYLLNKVYMGLLSKLGWSSIYASEIKQLLNLVEMPLRTAAQKESAKLDEIKDVEEMKTILRDPDRNLMLINTSKNFLVHVFDKLINGNLSTPEGYKLREALRLCDGINYNKFDSNGISILESVINAENSKCLTLLQDQKNLEYYPILDNVYANIMDPEFKKAVDKLKLNFKDLEDAIKFSSKTAFDKFANQLDSPFFEQAKPSILRQLDKSEAGFQAYVKINYGDKLN